ncbi:MAG: hypothetical protein Q8Q07_01100 [Dehalococcoidales bacterium]|nr:hypothetical protein [Dehalococcoidales bacterium]
MENRPGSPSIASLEHITSTPGITLAGFFTGKRPVTRASERQETASSQCRARNKALPAPDTAGHPEAVMIAIASGGRNGKQPSIHPGEEFALIFDRQIAFTR